MGRKPKIKTEEGMVNVNNNENTGVIITSDNSKIYSKKDFQSFMSTLTIVKDFNDSVTFNNGVAIFKTPDKSLWVKMNCVCPMDIELTKISSKIPIFDAYLGDTIQVSKTDRFYVINNGSDIIRFPIVPDLFKTDENTYNDMLSSLTVDDPILSWDIDSVKFAALRKYFSGFGVDCIKFIKEIDDPTLTLKVGDDGSTGSAELLSVNVDNQDLLPLAINSEPRFEFISAAGKSFTGISIKVYYVKERDIIVYTTSITTEFCNIELFRGSPREMPSY